MNRKKNVDVIKFVLRV